MPYNCELRFDFTLLFRKAEKLRSFYDSFDRFFGQLDSLEPYIVFGDCITARRADGVHEVRQLVDLDPRFETDIAAFRAGKGDITHDGSFGQKDHSRGGNK